MKEASIDSITSFTVCCAQLCTGTFRRRHSELDVGGSPAAWRREVRAVAGGDDGVRVEVGVRGEVMRLDVLDVDRAPDRLHAVHVPGEA